MARRMSLTTRSAGDFQLDDFALIFVPYGHCDETKILPCAKPLICLKGADGGHWGISKRRSQLDLKNDTPR